MLTITKELTYAIDALLNPRLSTFHWYETLARGNEIEVNLKEEEASTSITMVIRVVISEDKKQIYIPNIFLPFSMRRTGIGKRLIAAIYEISEKHSYSLLLVNMTSSFFERMKNRGAMVIRDDDCVQITRQTNLDQKRAANRVAGSD